MNRYLSFRTLPALAVAMILPIAAFAAPGTPDAGAKSAPSKSGMHNETVSTAKAAHKGHSAAKAHKTVQVDINTASREELMAVPGISDQAADKIIAGRPWKSRMEIVTKQILTRDEYAKVRGRLTAKPAPGAKSTENVAPGSKSPESK